MRMMNTRDKRKEKTIENGFITGKEALDLQAKMKEEGSIDAELVKQLTSALGGGQISKSQTDPGAILGCLRSQISSERHKNKDDAKMLTEALEGLIKKTKNVFAEQVQAYERETGKKFKPREKSSWRLNRHEAEVPEGSVCYEARGFCYSCEVWASIGCQTPRERSQILLDTNTFHTCPSCGEKESLRLDVGETFKQRQ